MGIFSFILENVGEFALGRILDRIFDDKAKNMEDAFNEAYNTWYVSHNPSVIQRNDYDRLKQRFIDYLCNKQEYKVEDEDEFSLYEEWLKVIERGTNAHEHLQSNINQKIINELGQSKAFQVQINEEMLIKLTELVESAIGIEDISKKQASLEREIGEIKILIANKGLDSAFMIAYLLTRVISREAKDNNLVCVIRLTMFSYIDIVVMVVDPLRAWRDLKEAQRKQALAYNPKYIQLSLFDDL